MTDDDSQPISVLLVEDDPGDVVLIEEAFEHNKVRNSLKIVGDGVEAMDYLRHPDSDRPDLVLLDLNLPRKNGLEVLAEVRADPGLAHIPVIVLTSSAARPDVQEAYARGANAFVVKPLELDAFMDLIGGIRSFWLELAQLPSA